LIKAERVKALKLPVVTMAVPGDIGGTPSNIRDEQYRPKPYIGLTNTGLKGNLYNIIYNIVNMHGYVDNFKIKNKHSSVNTNMENCILSDDVIFMSENSRPYLELTF
jgi:hypothetical protein